MFLSIACPSMSFERNPDYVLGVGKTREDAIISLASAIGVNIISTTSREISEGLGGIKENFSKKESVTFTSINEGVTINFENDIYYAYINKREYVSEHRKKYFDYCSMADSLAKIPIFFHKKNVIMGAQYLAYLELTAPLMQYFDRFSISEAESLKESILRFYQHSGDASMFNDRGWCTVSGPENEQSLLVGIEINDGYSWKEPYIFRKKKASGDGEHVCQLKKNMFYLSCRVPANCTQYRYTYEIIGTNESLIKINVPAEFQPVRKLYRR